MTSAPTAFGHTSDERRELADVAARVLQRHPADAGAGADLGWFGIGTPEASGGMGGTLGDVAPIIEAAGAALASTAVAWTVAVLSALGPEITGRGPADPVRALAAGTSLVAVPVGSPSVLCRSLQVSTARDPLLSGRVVVLNPAGADFVALPIQVAHGAQILVAGLRHERIRVSSLPAADETRALSEVIFDRWPVAEAACVASYPGVVEAWVAAVGLVAALDAVGAARVALERTLAYSAQRVQFGRPIGSNQAYKHRVASAFVELKLAQALAFRGAEQLGRDRSWALSAGIESTAGAVFVCGEAVQLHGGFGFTWEAGLHALLKRAKVDELIGQAGGQAATMLLERA